MHVLPTLLLAATASAQGGGNGLGGLVSGIAKGVMSSSAGKNGVALGPAPRGCSAFEILVARGTGEPGPFGVIVGDGLVNRVKRLVPGARGYAVQVGPVRESSSDLAARGAFRRLTKTGAGSTRPT
jgi:hypothetical protein